MIEQRNMHKQVYLKKKAKARDSSNDHFSSRIFVFLMSYEPRFYKQKDESPLSLSKLKDKLKIVSPYLLLL